MSAGTSIFSLLAEHLPVFQIILPLMAAPLIVILRRPGAAWAIALMVSWSAFFIALAILFKVLDGGVLTYALGGWAAPWGIEYRIDRLSALMLVIVTAIGSVAIPYALKSIAHEIPRDRAYLFYAMYLLNLSGLSGIAITGDVFNLFVFLEISSLSSYVMISLGNYRRALTAAYRYLIMGTLGATFYIIGVGMMYMMTGTLNMADLATLIPAVAETRTIIVALVFLTVGILLKVALFPLHLWLPNAYTFAPSMVTVFLASTGTKVAVYVLIRIYFTVFGGTRNFEIASTMEVLTVLAVIAMFVGSAVAIFQANVKRMLAYSSVAQIGYMVLGISLANLTGLTGGILHVFNHALMKAALFMVLGCVFLRIGSVKIKDMDGLARDMPWTMACFVIAGLSLIGVPLTVGFISKWYLVQAAMEKGWWPVAVLVVVSSLLAIIYVWRVVEAAYLRPRPEGSAKVSEAPLSMLAPLWVMTAASVYFGIDATRTAGIASEAAKTLMRVLP